MSAEQVRPGYQLTEVGVIPEDWDCVDLKEIAQVKGGKRLPKGVSLEEIPNDHPYIRVSDMHPGGISTDNIRYVPEDVAPLINFTFRYFVGQAAFLRRR